MLADSFGQMAYPSMAAAGAAMHSGRGRRAVVLALDAGARLDTTGANIDEARVVAAFGYLLSDDPEQALTELERVAVDSSPFALAARATARAMLGDRHGAVADADSVERLVAEPGSHVSYWDSWVARIAGLACAEGADLDRRVGAIGAEVGDLADVVVRAFARDVLARVSGEPASEHPSSRAMRGWAVVAERLVPNLGCRERAGRPTLARMTS